MLNKEIEMDERERNRVNDMSTHYLVNAVENLLGILHLSSEDELDCVIKFINLWLENTGDSILCNTIDTLLRPVGSYKFVKLTYQLFSRLGDSSACEGFQRVLGELVYRMCSDHPHHTLWNLFSLAYADKVSLILTYSTNNIYTCYTVCTFLCIII